MNNLKASKIVVWVLILSLILVGCDYPSSNGEREATLDEKDGIISGSTAETFQRFTEIAARFNSCTSVGCHSTLRIDISGFIPETYTIEAQGKHGEKVIIHCPSDAVPSHLPPSYGGSLKSEYLLFDDLMDQNPELSRVAEFCESEEGIIYKKNHDDAPAIIAAQCFEPKMLNFHNSSCSSGKGAYLVEFIPSEVMITIYWEENSITKSFSPSYSSFQPNGPNCPPTCYTGHITIELP